MWLHAFLLFSKPNIFRKMFARPQHQLLSILFKTLLSLSKTFTNDNVLNYNNLILCAIQYVDQFYHLEVFENLSFVLMNAEEKYSWNLATWLLLVANNIFTKKRLQYKGHAR